MSFWENEGMLTSKFAGFLLLPRGTVTKASSLRWKSIILTFSAGWGQWHLRNVKCSYSRLSAETEGEWGSETWWGNFQVWENSLMNLESWYLHLKRPRRSLSSALKPLFCSVQDPLLISGQSISTCIFLVLGNSVPHKAAYSGCSRLFSIILSQKSAAT